MHIDIIAGARPNFMKIAPIIEAIRHSPFTTRSGERDANSEQRTALSYRLIHTGQHYDKKMSADFFEQLGIPEPDVNLNARSGTQAEQTARIMTRYEKLLLEAPVDLCLVVGDVTSTMACSIVAKKMSMKVAHVEAGIRSHDLSMPEEINRMVTDSITDYFFTTSEVANTNLRKAGIPEERIFFVGNTMIDTLLKNRPRFTPPPIWEEAQLEKGRYLVMTMHRPANVDEEQKLKAFMEAILNNVEDLPVIFPVHPRTGKILDRLGIEAKHLRLIGPLPYLEFNYLVEHSKAVLTDSGGITEETTVMGVPCLTLRDNTERPETITQGTNELVGTDPANIAPALRRVFSGNWKTGSIPEKWDGGTGERIVEVLLRLSR
ncbi:non-hydrolyzing UDP-N-acetylglucosamine 2-epimerase [Phaeodactylibacter xiamenensis]|uniref:non-hydrolyzing UDP-N-acetylglucosamine 2-epimerase n=1 Tax=Phaeodactylibacter xiamenensis TaxID=1524460 RepID=UPI0024A7EAF4|nr:UDP-N-acetylglucosamine 2-epimerase (non-hydrolyzing) [Phaeodactylibacter xiamenensis]